MDVVAMSFMDGLQLGGISLLMSLGFFLGLYMFAKFSGGGY